jgi:hypothetical protein
MSFGGNLQHASIINSAADAEEAHLTVKLSD